MYLYNVNETKTLKCRHENIKHGIAFRAQPTKFYSVVVEVDYVGVKNDFSKLTKM